MTCRYLAYRAASAAMFQRHHGDRRGLRELYRRSFSFLRYFHHQWE